jgi:hypothetical protein
MDNICVVLGGQVFQKSAGIPMGTNCAPLLADLFLYSYEAKFIQKLLHKRRNILLWLSIRYFDMSTMFYLFTTMNFTHVDISQWTGNQRHHRVFHICFVFRYIIEIGYQRQINDSTLWQTGRFQFLYRQLSLPLVYLAMLQFHLHMVFIYHSWFGMQ